MEKVLFIINSDGAHLKEGVMVAILVLLLLVSPVFASTGGPDDYGYQWIDSREAGGPVFNWIDITETGTRLSLTDDSHQNIPLGGTFFFYGNGYTNVNVCSNGWLSFTYGGSNISLPAIPNTGNPNALLAVYNCDLNPSYSVAPGVFYERRGNLFIIEYAICEYGHSSGPVQYFEVILDMGGGTILYQYRSTSVSSRTVTIGIENETGTTGLQYYRSSGAVFSNLAVLFYAYPTAPLPYSCDFDTSTGDFVLVDSSATNWELGSPAGFSAHSTPNCWGTVLSGSYTGLADWWLWSPSFILQAVDAAKLRFWHWYETEEGADGGNVSLSVDGGLTWNLITPIGGYPVESMEGASAIFGEPAFSGVSDGWEQVTFDISAYCGYNVVIGFHFASDATESDHSGWYIDDVEVYEPSGTVVGTVDLSRTEPDDGVLVEIPDVDRSTYTDSLGGNVLSYVPAGVWNVVFSKPGFAPVTVPGVEVVEDDTVRVDVTLYHSLFNSDFEDSAGTFLASPDTVGWEWGTPDSSLVIPFSGSRCWGTNLSGRYSPYANWTLDVPLHLEDTEHPVLRFYHWYQTEGAEGYIFDGGNIKAIVDTVTMAAEILYPVPGFSEYDGVCASINPFLGGEPVYGGFDSTRCWEEARFDLVDYAGGFIYLRFHFASDAASNYSGWFFDDLAVIDGLSVRELDVTPGRFFLSNGYPNPFNSSVSLGFFLPRPGEITFEIYSIGGELVARRFVTAGSGYGEVVFDKEFLSAPSGLYLVRAESCGVQQTRKLLLLK